MNWKEFRKSKLMGIGEFAEYLGVSRMTYYNWERGFSKPVMPTRRKLVERFGDEILSVIENTERSK